MTSSSDKPISTIQISPESARVIEASIAAGTSGSTFWLLHICVALICIAVAIGAITVVLVSALGVLNGDGGSIQKAGFALLVGLPFAIALTFQLQFLRRWRQGG